METECEEWQGSISPQGYGQVYVNGRTVGAHRAAWVEANGPLPTERNMVIDHLCRNRKCVRVDHLELVTQQENVRRGDRCKPRTHCKNQHELNEDTIVPWRTGNTCRKCDIERKSSRGE